MPDKPPVVTLTQPAEQKDKPGWVAAVAGGRSVAAGRDVIDDVGVAAARLNLKVDNGPTLPRAGVPFADALKLPHGGNPTTVEYKDFVDLTKLKNPADPLFSVRPGMVLEYWLTAEDACDYSDPNKPNVGESKHYRVQIVEPTNNPQAGPAAEDEGGKRQEGRRSEAGPTESEGRQAASGPEREERAGQPVGQRRKRQPEE